MSDRSGLTSNTEFSEAQNENDSNQLIEPQNENNSNQLTEL